MQKKKNKIHIMRKIIRKKISLEGIVAMIIILNNVLVTRTKIYSHKHLVSKNAC